MRYRFKTEYDGSAFAGWQVQPDQITVQSELERVFEIVFREPTKVFGSGRTDAGVHARGQVVQMDTDIVFDISKVQKSINGLLKPEVSIRELELASPEFSARFDPLHRYYIYTIQTRKSPLNRERSWLVKYKLDTQILAEEAQAFIGEHDFIDYCIPRDDYKTTLCTLFRFDVEEFDGGLRFHIEGNRFLHWQVRAMVGALIEVSRGKAPKGTIQSPLLKKSPAPRVWAPPQGLSLEKVVYSDY